MVAAIDENPVCPLASTISPCICSSLGTGVKLDCSNQRLDDSQMSSILDAFLTTPISPLTSLLANDNSLILQEDSEQCLLCLIKGLVCHLALFSV